MMQSLAAFLEKKAKAKVRKDKRKAKAAVLWVGDQIGRTDLKKKIVTALGHLDRKINGNSCRIHGAPCVGSLAYHLLPQHRGDAFRFIEKNVVWACRRANYGEVMNRSDYADKHEQIFGAPHIQAIKDEAARIKASPEWIASGGYTRADLFKILENIKIKLLDNTQIGK